MDPATIAILGQVLLGLVDRVGTIGKLMEKGQVTDADLDALMEQDNLAAQKLNQLIATRRATGE